MTKRITSPFLKEIQIARQRSYGSSRRSGISFIFTTLLQNSYLISVALAVVLFTSSTAFVVVESYNTAATMFAPTIRAVSYYGSRRILQSHTRSVSSLRRSSFDFTKIPSDRCHQRSRLCSSSSYDDDPLPWGDPISSVKNPTVKSFKALLTKRKKRSESDSTVLEGHRLVLDTLLHPATSSLVRHVLVSQQALDRSPRLKNTLLTSSSHVKVNVVTDEVLRACCDTVTPQGVVAHCARPAAFRGVFSSSAAPPHKKSRLFLMLDGVSDPGNMGTLLRSSAAVGVTAVLLLPDCTDVWAPKAVRSGMGASLHVPLVTVGSLEEGLVLLEQECGCPRERVYAATMDTNSDAVSSSSSSSPAHFDVDWVGDDGTASALCIGKEGTGLSAPVRRAVADGTVRSVHVPMEGDVVESLNAAVCGSVVLFEFGRQKLLQERERRRLSKEEE